MANYKKIRIGKGQTIDEHRLIMERSLGRKLERFEVVHHKDGNKLNNAIDNLEIMTLQAHSRMHMPSGRTLPESTRAKISNSMVGVGIPKKVSPEMVIEIHASNLGCGELAKKLNVHRATISRIRNFKTSSNWNPRPSFDTLVKSDLTQA